MAQRKRLGIRFDISYTTATGAVIYFLNIIKALNFLPDEKKPEVLAFVSNDGPLDDLKTLDYPYLKILPIKYLPKGLRMINRIYRTVINGRKVNLINAKTYDGEPLDGALSLVIPSEDIKTKRQLIWIADLQIFHLPQNYTAAEIAENKKNKNRDVRAGHDIVLCSQWCIDDFNSIFPGHKCRMHRLRFATLHPDFSHIEFSALQEKFGIAHPYFIVSNQFWIHKNHMAVLKAVNGLKEKNPDILVVFTGHPKVSSAKSKGYVEGLFDYIKDNKLEKHIRFLGLIQREEQLCLLKNSLAIIQPSFFESWNTTVEDAKVLGKFIILSNLTVHLEQITDHVAFFDPNDEKQLMICMQDVIDNPPALKPSDYKKNVHQFAEDIIKMIE